MTKTYEQIYNEIQSARRVGLKEVDRIKDTVVHSEKEFQEKDKDFRIARDQRDVAEDKVKELQKVIKGLEQRLKCSECEYDGCDEEYAKKCQGE